MTSCERKPDCLTAWISKSIQSKPSNLVGQVLRQTERACLADLVGVFQFVQVTGHGDVQREQPVTRCVQGGHVQRQYRR